jgi:hypothetical protein
MAAATTNTTGNNETPDLAQMIREQLASTVLHGQQSSVDAAEVWFKAVWVLPGSGLLMAQLDLALKLADVAFPDEDDSPMPLPNW